MPTPVPTQRRAPPKLQPPPPPPHPMLDPSYAQHAAYAYMMSPHYAPPKQPYAPMPQAPGRGSIDVMSAHRAGMMPPPALPVRGHQQ